MPMVYRVSPKMAADKKARDEAKNRKGPRAVPSTGAGQGGSLTAFASASGAVDGR